MSPRVKQCLGTLLSALEEERHFLVGSELLNLLLYLFNRLQIRCLSMFVNHFLTSPVSTST